MLDLTKLQNRSVNELNYSDTITIDKSMYENTDIRNLSDVKVNAHIKRVTDSSYNMSLIIDGVMTLPCSVTLKDVLYPFHIETEVKISNDDENLEEYVKIIQNSIDECLDEDSIGKNIHISYDKETDILRCEDDGRGFDESEYPLNIFCTTLQSGSKFMRADGTPTSGEFGVNTGA